MKHLLLIALLAGCSSTEVKQCGVIPDAVTKTLAVKYAEFQDCNLEKTINVFAKAEGKMLSCQSGIQYSGINADSVKCSIVPQLVKALADFDLLDMECKKTGGDLSALFKKFLNCK